MLGIVSTLETGLRDRATLTLNTLQPTVSYELVVFFLFKFIF